MTRAGKYIITSAVVMGLSFLFSSNDAEATATPKMNLTSKTLTISVIDRGNSYGKTQLKIKNKKKFRIKKISYSTKNCEIAKVSKKGIVTAQRPGNTKITATIKFKNKSTKNKKYKNKKITINITVKAKYKNEIPKTDMRYDEAGKTEELYPYTPIFDNKGNYSNDASYIARFPVYVETDYDTDLDGKQDLIMAFVQVPRSAVEGYYKAPVIMEANPYTVGGHRDGNTTEKILSTLKNNVFDYNLLMRAGEKRAPKTETTTKDAVKKATKWITDTGDNGFGTTEMNSYARFLTHGYALVSSPGLGGFEESEGLECCGERVEALAYAAIIEWLNGDRIGFADKNGTKRLRADWCNGHTAVMGHSYVGTMAYEVATTGVKGLDTVIPSGAISNWYDYANTQGVAVNVVSNYMSYLGDTCAKRFYFIDEEQEKKDSVYKTYLNYLYQKSYDEVAANGQYNDYWARFNYTKAKPTVPALLVEGLNDDNVDSKQTEMMRKAFIDAGCTCKVIYHQGRHDRLSSSRGVIRVNGELYDDLIDRWMVHYMTGVDNGIEKMKDFTVQSNVDGSWTTYDAGRKTDKIKFAPSTSDAESTVHFDSKQIPEGEEYGVDYLEETKEMHADWEMKAEEDLHLSGSGVLHVRAKMPDAKKNHPVMFAILYDESDEEFDAPYCDFNYGDYYGGYKVNYENVVDDTEPEKRYEADFDMIPTRKNMICCGAVNLRMPGAGWEPETCKEPATPIQDDTYYDYTIYLNPTEYTVRKGHRLHLYFVPIGRAMSRYKEGFKFVDSYKTEGVGYKVVMASAYDFTIDNKKSYAELPLII